MMGFLCFEACAQRHQAQFKMASDRNEQWRLIEEKKQALLRRLEEKKRKSTDNNPPLPPDASTTTNTPPPLPKPGLFVNDGSFLARFQAMQKTSSSSTTNIDNSTPNKTPVSLKISSAKKNTPNRPALKTHDVFEKDEDSLQNGKQLFFTSFHIY